MAITNLQDDNITSLSNLVFFTEKGFQIPMQKIYTIEFEILPNNLVADNFISNPKGHFMFNITDSKNPTIYIVIDEPGKIIITDKEYVKKYDYETNINITDTLNTPNDIILLNKDITVNKISSRVRNRFTGNLELTYTETTENIHNNVKITFNTLTESIVKTYPIDFVFNNVTTNIISSKDTEDNIIFTYHTINTLSFTTIENSPVSGSNVNILHALIDINFGDEKNNISAYETLFPGVRYMGVVMQDKVATNFVAASTVIILEEQDTNKFRRPNFGKYNGKNIGSKTDYTLHFEFQKNSEMRFISKESIDSIIWDDHYTVEDLTYAGTTQSSNGNVSTYGSEGFNELITYYYDRPIYFSVGFLTEIEGCYQNVMAMYLYDKTNDKKYLLGLLTFLTESEGEDERYRALLGNLGIPDPINYPNIFAEQDPKEEGIDWTLINNKSKELMITYDNIFPYAGTYKALLGAIKFLGYQDLIFKEWYKIKDQNNRDKYVAIQTYDLQTGETLMSKLKKANVEFGEFERYKKLNRLTMIYHLDDIDNDSGEYLNVYFKRKNVESDKLTTDAASGIYKLAKTTHYADYNDTFLEQSVSQYFDLPHTYKLYQYRSMELLAKLYSVKCWLEKYILGVNCYISDICAEGIIIERLKTQAYVTEHYLKDLTISGHFTPKILNVSDFVNSSTILTCTLNEFNCLTLETYEDVPIESFINTTITHNNTISGIKNNIYISAPLSALVVANEYQYILENHDIVQGSLAEFTDSEYIDNPLIIEENTLTFFNESKNITKIRKECLPIIELKTANLRYCHGDWNNNIKYSISVIYDQKTGNEYYQIYDKEVDDVIYSGPQKILLYPYNASINESMSDSDIINNYKLYWTIGEDVNISDNNENNNQQEDIQNSDFIYTSHTKWNVPLIIIRNYNCGNVNELLKGDFILEITSGNLLFKNNDNLTDGKAIGCDIKFRLDFEGFKQNIDLRYIYESERLPIYSYDITSLNNIINSGTIITDEIIDQYLTVNTKVDIKVNRLGNYSIYVKAYDGFNNIFFNKSDDITLVTTTPIKIDKILNTEYMVNHKDFFDKNQHGTLLTDTEKINMFYDISTYDINPIMPQNYRIYDIDPVLNTSNTIEYDNISYAFDTPNTGDFIIFNNFTEKILYIENIIDFSNYNIDTNNIDNTKKYYKIKLLDENPNKDTIKNADYIGLCIYDNIQKNILTDIYPLKVIDVSIKDYEKYKYDVNNSYMIVEDNTSIDNSENTLTLDKFVELCKQTELLDSSSYFINSLHGYIYSAEELIINDVYTDISINYDLKQTYIIDNKQHFVKNQVIKICLSSEEEIHNNYTKNIIDNETAYRIIDVSIQSITDDNNTVSTQYIYILDGLFDFYKLNNKLYHNKAEYYQPLLNISPMNTKYPYIVKICPVHLRATQYILRVNNTGTELLYQFNNSTIYKAQVNYANKPLLFDSYLDTTYSAMIFNYDPDMLNNIWVNILNIFKQTDNLYLYRDFPITIDKGRTIILRPDITQNKLTTSIKNNKNEEFTVPIKTIWTWRSFIVDDQENWHGSEQLLGKQTIFKSINNYLTIKPELLGTQDSEMKCIDIYGNILTNYGEGSIYVKGDGKTVINRAEQETRDVYYKDVYIVGFSGFAHVNKVLSANGETTTITNVTGYGSSKSSDTLLTTNYTIYYNDGTVQKNVGADVVLLTNTGKESKTNKIKLKVNKSEYPHKHECFTINGIFKIKNPNKRDLVKSEIPFNTKILQYGYSITTNIYNLSFELNNIIKEGHKELTNDIISNYIKNISYTLTRSAGEIEYISGNTLSDVNLKLVSYTYIDDYFGQINYILPNNTNKIIHKGILKITVQFFVNGITDIIETSGIGIIYQD